MSRLPKILLLAAICLPLLAPPPGARAQSEEPMDNREAISMQNQIDQLRQELQIMQQNMQNGTQAPYQSAPPPLQSAPGSNAGPAGGNDTVAELTVRVGTLEEENRTLRGRVDDLNNQIQQMNAALTKQIGDLAFKLNQGAQPPAGTQDQPGPDQNNGNGDQSNGDQPAPAPPARHRSVAEALHDGQAAMARRDYQAAADAAHEVLAAAHGAHQADGELLLARAEGGLHQFHEAAADYFKSFKHAPKSPDAPIALLGMAFSFIGEHHNKDACQALALLKAQFPHPSAVVRANAADARRRAGCK